MIQKSEKEIRRIVREEIEKAVDEDEGVTRRDVLKVAGALGVGGLLGGGASSSVGGAEAAIGDDGTLGAADDRWDAYLDEAEANSVSTNDSLTDPAGVEHTGELADIDDVGGSIPSDVVTDGDGVDREIYVIANGATDPSGAGPEDIIFEEES